MEDEMVEEDDEIVVACRLLLDWKRYQKVDFSYENGGRIVEGGELKRYKDAAYRNSTIQLKSEEWKWGLG